jgi:hypothetical protein
MRLFQKLFSLFAFICLLVASASSFATSWPVFIAPDQNFLTTNNYIETNSCPRGQGKLVSDININIRENLCRSYCMDSWVWKGHSDGKCHELRSQFAFQGYQITHYRNEDGSTNYSEVVANYGLKGASTHLFQFVISTMPGESWHCVQAGSNSTNVLCANDT